MSSLPLLTIDSLKSETRVYAQLLSQQEVTSLYGITDGKAVGTYVEQRFRDYLNQRYTFLPGNSALGIDFPGLGVDLKVTSIRQPQSSSPFRNASQKVYGLGYALLVMSYDKVDNPTTRVAMLTVQNVVFITSERTGDYQTTFGILEILRRNGRLEDIDAFLEERNLPLDDIGRNALAKRILDTPPLLGYLTISNALQWRLQYGRAIALAVEGVADGLENLLE